MDFLGERLDTPQQDRYFPGWDRRDRGIDSGDQAFEIESGNVILMPSERARRPRIAHCGRDVWPHILEVFDVFAQGHF